MIIGMIFSYMSVWNTCRTKVDNKWPGLITFPAYVTYFNYWADKSFCRGNNFSDLFQTLISIRICLWKSGLTHLVNLFNIGSDNDDLLCLECQAITQFDVDLFPIRTLGTHFSPIWIRICDVSWKKKYSDLTKIDGLMQDCSNSSALAIAGIIQGWF